jgi:hypothetical protein
MGWWSCRMVVKDGMAYLDKSASVCDGGLLAHLLHDFGLCVHFERGLWGFCVFRRVLKWCVEVWVV